LDAGGKCDAGGARAKSRSFGELRRQYFVYVYVYVRQRRGRYHDINEFRRNGFKRHGLALELSKNSVYAG
jgi:hypothetical protein